MANLSNINGKFVVEQTTGYVGVGTTDPNFLIEAAGANSEIALNSTSASIYRLRSTSSDSFIITKNGVGDRLVIAGNGNATFAGSLTAGNVTVNGSSRAQVVRSSNDQVVASFTCDGNAISTIGFKGTSGANDYNTRIGVDGNDFVAYTVNTVRMRIDTSGNTSFSGNVSVNNLALPDGHDIGWDGGFSSSKPTLAANGTTMKMYPSGNAASAQFTLSPTQATFAGKIIAPKLSIQNQINTTSSNLEINYENGDGTTTNFKDFYVRDGKNAVILNIQGSSKNATFASSIDAGGRIKVSGGNSDQYYFEGARNGVGVTYRLYDNANNIYHDSYTSQVFRLNQNGGSGGDLIITGGNVGLGKSSPYYPVDATEIGANSHAWGSSGATFGQDHYQIRELNNLLWNAYDRFKDYGTSSNLTYQMFDGNMDTGTALPTNSTHVIEIDFSAQGAMTYPYGYTVISFYYIYSNFTSVSGEQYHVSGTYAGQWRPMGTPVDIRGSAGSVRVVKIPGGNNNYVGKFRYTFVTGSSSVNVTDICYMTSRPAGYPISAYMRGDRNNDWFKNINFKNSSFTTIGSIVPGSTSTAYNTSSDYRLKENIVSITDALNRVSQLKPSRFNFISDADKTVDGFLAHEVQEIIPEAITGEKDAVDEQGNPKLQAIDQSKLVPLLVAAIQELKADNDSLKARIETLENN